MREEKGGRREEEFEGKRERYTHKILFI
jgi:hypothetical protein